MELNTKGAESGGAGREISSNTSLPSVLTHKHFFTVSAICFDRSDFASGKVLVQSCGRDVCNQGNNLVVSEIECVAGRW